MGAQADVELLGWEAEASHPVGQIIGITFLLLLFLMCQLAENQ